MQPPVHPPQPATRLLCRVSIAYDAILGVLMLAGQGLIERLGGLASLNHPVSGQLNGLFLLCVAAGYWIPLRGLEGGRAYLWIFGVALKAAGAALIAVRIWAFDDPRFFLVFTFGDGLLALWSWRVLSQPVVEVSSTAPGRS